jgi:hypothetical protein
MTVKPSVEFVPGEVEFRQRRLVELLELEPRAKPIEILPMQDIELDEGPPPLRISSMLGPYSLRQASANAGKRKIPV